LDLLKRMLEPYPDERITMAQIREDKWFQEQSNAAPWQQPVVAPHTEARFLEFLDGLLEERRYASREYPAWREMYDDCKQYLDVVRSRVQNAGE
jgi:hypothetical protein